MTGIKDILKLALGRAAEVAWPELGREIDEGRNKTRAPALKRAIVFVRRHRALGSGDTAFFETSLAAFWKGETGDRFHQRAIEARFNTFLTDHAQIVDALARLLEDAPDKFGRLVEIGCGDGAVLRYCADHLPGTRAYVGLDINAAVIREASAHHAGDPRLSFAEADACAWLDTNPQPGTVLLSNGGVLEYLSQATLDTLLRTLAAQRPAAIVLVEPVAPDHDLARQTESVIFGWENSFSHNHAYRLQQAGFEIAYRETFQKGRVRWMLMIGWLDGAAAPGP